MNKELLQLSRFVVNSAFVDQDNIAKRILFQTHSRAVAVVSELDWRRLQKDQTQEIGASEVHALVNARILVDAGCNELSDVLQENEHANIGTKSLYQVIMPTANCQLACNENSCASYCGQEHHDLKMGDDIQDALLARLQGKLERSHYQGLHIGWFGGEPLLGINAIRRLSPKLKALAESFNLKYTAKIVTNGLALTLARAQELHCDLGVTTFEITLDGIAEFHDRRRCLKSGHGPTFKTIFNHLTELCHAPELREAQVILRSNVDRRNQQGVFPLIDMLREADLHQRLHYYVAPVHPWGNAVDHLSMSREEFGAFELDVLAKLISEGFPVSLLPGRKEITCLSTNRSADVVDPYGLVHNCTETPLVPAYQMKRKKSLGIINQAEDPEARRTNDYAIGSLSEIGKWGGKGEELTGFNGLISEGKVPCTECSMLPVCGGGCPLSWKQGHIPCPPAKQNIQGRLLLAIVQKRVLESAQV